MLLSSLLSIIIKNRLHITAEVIIKFEQSYKLVTYCEKVIIIKNRLHITADVIIKFEKNYKLVTYRR